MSRKRARTDSWHALLCELHKNDLLSSSVENALVFAKRAVLPRAQLQVWMNQLRDRIPGSYTCSLREGNDALRFVLPAGETVDEKQATKSSLKTVEWQNYDKCNDSLKQIFSSALACFARIYDMDVVPKGMGYVFFVKVTSFEFRELVAFYSRCPEYLPDRIHAAEDGRGVCLAIEVVQ